MSLLLLLPTQHVVAGHRAPGTMSIQSKSKAKMSASGNVNGEAADGGMSDDGSDAESEIDPLELEAERRQVCRTTSAAQPPRGSWWRTRLESARFESTCFASTQFARTRAESTRFAGARFESTRAERALRSHALRR
eukprot:COSAG01_NODE_15744_length_1303_cov_1.322822_2_plen_136_part_00